MQLFCWWLGPHCPSHHFSCDRSVNTDQMRCTSVVQCSGLQAGSHLKFQPAASDLPLRAWQANTVSSYSLSSFLTQEWPVWVWCCGALPFSPSRPIERWGECHGTRGQFWKAEKEEVRQRPEGVLWHGRAGNWNRVEGRVVATGRDRAMLYNDVMSLPSSPGREGGSGELASAHHCSPFLSLWRLVAQRRTNRAVVRLQHHQNRQERHGFSQWHPLQVAPRACTLSAVP